jgi:hypothetical protein
MSEFTIEKQRPSHLWAPGQSGNPAGRPKGARSRLAEDFLRDLTKSWETEGPAALLTCAREHPEKYVKIVADLMPREAVLDVGISVTAINDAVAAYRLLKALPVSELRKLHADHADDDRG